MKFGGGEKLFALFCCVDKVNSCTALLEGGEREIGRDRNVVGMEPPLEAYWHTMC